MRAHPLLALILLGLVLLGSARAQTLWMGAKYGMSVAEVQAEIPSAVPPGSNHYSLLDGSDELLRIPRTDVIELPFVVSFFFYEQKLRQVSLSLRNYPNWEAEAAFRNLLPILREKYGQERREDQKTPANSVVLKAKWTRDRAEVSLVLWQYPNLPADLFIDYRGTSRQGVEKL